MDAGYLPALVRQAAHALPWLLLSVAALAPPPLRGEEKAPPPTEAAAPLSLTRSQQQAVGIRIERPLPVVSAPAIEAYGTVLDPLALLTDLGRVQSTQAAASAAAADEARLGHLYRDDAQASLKAWQASQVQSAEAAAQARAALMGFSLQWGPLASWGADERRSLLEGLRRGDESLLRADVPGPYPGGTLDRRALVEIDGANVTARVLGALPRTDAQAQSSGWLLLLEHAPGGFGPGARALVRLQAAATTAGLLVPAAALLYAERGAYVYRQLGARGTDTFHYDVVPVKPLTRIGNAWLVDGLARTDEVVVQGAGVLWSLQGISGFSAAEEEHD
jgi:hypothetical protein